MDGIARGGHRDRRAERISAGILGIGNGEDAD